MKRLCIQREDGEPATDSSGNVYQPSKTIFVWEYMAKRRQAMLRQVWRYKMIDIGVEPDTGMDIEGWNGR